MTLGKGADIITYKMLFTKGEYIMTKKEALEKIGFIVTTTSGGSMRPLFRHKRDNAVIVRPQCEPKKNDVALFIFKDEYVLHRIIKVKDDYYITRGDNCAHTETVLKSEVIGVLESFTRNGRSYNCKSSFSYRLYCRLWAFLTPFRIAFYKIRDKIVYLMKR